MGIGHWGLEDVSIHLTKDSRKTKEGYSWLPPQGGGKTESSCSGQGNSGRCGNLEIFDLREESPGCCPHGCRAPGKHALIPLYGGSPGLGKGMAKLPFQ